MPDEYRRSFAKDVEDLKAQLKREQELNRASLPGVLGEGGVPSARAADWACRVPSPRVCVTVCQARWRRSCRRCLGCGSLLQETRGVRRPARWRTCARGWRRPAPGWRVQEVKLRNEVDQIMKLWEEAQSTNGAEVEHLQERILELKQQLADTKARLRKAEGSLEEYSF